MSLCNRKESKGGGLLVAVKEDTDISMIITDIDSDKEQMWVKIKTPAGSYNMGILYGLHETRSTNEEIDEWFYKLETSISKWADEPILIIGDMNAHIGSDDKGICGNHNEINKNGRWWRALIERRNILLVNNTNLCSGKWTRKSLDGKNSIIDFVLCNEYMCDNIKRMQIDEVGEWTLSRFRKINGKVKETPSDHNSILVELSIKSKVVVNKEKVWRITEESLANFKKGTNHIVMKEQWNSGGDVNNKYKRWFKQMKNLRYQHFTKATKKSKYRSKTIKEKIKMKNKIRRELTNIKNNGLTGGDIEENVRERLSKVLTEIGNAIECERKEKIMRRMQRIVEKQSTATNEIWKVRRNVIKRTDAKMAVEDNDGNLLTCKEDILLRHNEYYSSLLQARKPDPAAEGLNNEIEENFKLNMENKTYDLEPINEIFTMEELENVIQNLQTGKCPGRDEITNEILKSAGKDLKTSLLKMINWFWTEEKFPDELAKIHIKSIYKGKGKTSSLSNHRGIFLGSEIIKLYEKLMWKRCAPKVDAGLSEFQAGGRPNRSISDHTFILRSLMQHFKYMNIPLIIEFLDLRTAFDKMSLKHVLNDLWRCNVRGKIWRTIYNINQRSNISIKTALGHSPEFNIGESLKQGSVLASSLAAMHTDSLSQLFSNEGLGVMYGDIRINCLLFQDDIVKIETSTHNLNKANEMITHYQQMNLMEFHQDKSKYIKTSKDETDIKLGTFILKETNSYQYLGDIISADGILKDTIEARSKLCTSTVAELNSIIEETVDENILIEAVITYHNSIIIPKLCLNTETWCLNSVELKALESIQNKSLKRMLRLPQGTPSQGLRAELGINSIENVISKRKLLYLHRVLNQPDGNITKRIMLQQMELPEDTWLSDTLNLCRGLYLCDDLKTITDLPKVKWKNLIKGAIERDETEKLTKWTANSKKYTSVNLKVTVKKYIQYLPPALAITMLKTRLGMIELKSNYRSMHKDTKCRKCQSEEETLMHVLKCCRGSEESNTTTSDEAEDIINGVEDKEQNIVTDLATDIRETMMQLKEMVLVPDCIPESTLDPATSLEEDTC